MHTPLQKYFSHLFFYSDEHHHRSRGFKSKLWDNVTPIDIEEINNGINIVFGQVSLSLDAKCLRNRVFYTNLIQSNLFEDPDNRITGNVSCDDDGKVKITP